MARLLFLCISLCILSCGTQIKKDKVDLVKRYNYQISIDVWNGFSGFEEKYILNNLSFENFDSTDSKNNSIKPFTFLHISYPRHFSNQNKPIVPIDTSIVQFSRNQSDTLFNLTRSFFKNLEFNNYDTSVNGTITKPIVYDDSHATIELYYNGRFLKATISSISNPTISTEQLHTLLQFVNKFWP